MTVKTMHDLLETALTYVLDFERKVAKAAPDMASASHDAQLKTLFGKTGTKSEDYARKVEAVFSALGKPAKTNENQIAAAMIGEVQGMIEMTEPGPVRDAALIVAANQQQAFRIASYGSCEAYAESIDKSEALAPLREALRDSKNGDAQFNAIAEGSVNPAAAKAA